MIVLYFFGCEAYQWIYEMFILLLRQIFYQLVICMCLIFQSFIFLSFEDKKNYIWSNWGKLDGFDVLFFEFEKFKKNCVAIKKEDCTLELKLKS